MKTVLNSLESLKTVMVVPALPKKEKQPTPSHTLETREHSATIMSELLSLSKTSKATLRHLKSVGFDGFKKTLSKPQNCNEWQFSQLCASPSLVVKFMTDGQRQKFIDEGNKVTPTAYLNVIKKASCLDNAKFRKIQKSK